MESSHKVGTFLADYFSKLGIQTPICQIVLGSGFSGAFDILLPTLKKWDKRGEVFFSDVPGMHSSSAPGHHGKFLILQNKKASVLFQMGRLHGYEGIPVRDVVAPVMGGRLAGIEKFILTNAAGSLTKKFKVGSVMLLTDHVNMTGLNPLLGPNPVDLHFKPLGPRFLDMADAYSPKMRAALKKHLKASKVTVNEGVYLGLLGPNYETPAEIKLFAKWGLHAVGMSTVWENLSLRHSGAEVVGLSLMTNLGCGLVKKPLDHQEVLDVAKKSAQQIIKGLLSYVEAEL